MKLTKIFAGALAALAVTAGAANADMQKVRIGTEGAYKPFNYYDSAGNLVGFDIDISNAICEEAKLDCEFVAQDWDGIIPALLANKYDAIIASMSITEERMKKVDFTGPYYTTPAQFIAAKGSGITDTSPDALKGKIVGVQSSTIHANFMEGEYPGVELKLYGKQDEANLDLSNGRVDLVMADSAILLDFVSSDDGSCCEFVGPSYYDPKYHGSGAGIAVRKGEEDLKKKLDDAILAIYQNGKYKEINDKYFPFSVWAR